MTNEQAKNLEKTENYLQGRVIGAEYINLLLVEHLTLAPAKYETLKALTEYIASSGFIAEAREDAIKKGRPDLDESDEFISGLEQAAKNFLALPIP